MEVLHICRTEPDETVSTLIQEVSGPEAHILHLYADDVDWEQVVDAIFEAPKVISWW
ncbi:MAG: hypothetical protein R6U55_00905 [Desulfovermiculus sp.]